MKNGIQDRIDTILSSLDQTKRASAPEYLYTRIKGRMQQKQEPSSTLWLLRPVPLITALLFFLFINAGLIWNQETINSDIAATPEITTTSEAQANPETEVPYAVAAEYRLHDNLTFYDNSREISSR